VVAIKAPLLIIFNQKNGKSRFTVDFDGQIDVSVPVNFKFKGLLSNVDVIDSSGLLFRQQSAKISGINWSLYFYGSPLQLIVFFPLGLISFLVGILFCSVMVRIQFNLNESSSQASLKEIKIALKNVIKSNPKVYTYAPVGELIGRVNRASTIEELIVNIVKD
jgi:hypothetical protein